jgi:hypothetical protein
MLTFDVGVELGQLICVAAVLALRAPSARLLRPRGDLPRYLLACAIGSLSML